MHTVQFLNNLVTEHQLWVYLIIFLVTIVEGEVIAISAGILVLLGALNFYTCLALIFIAAVIKTFLGYGLGSFIQKKWGSTKIFTYMQNRILALMPHFNERPFWSIFISKFIIGVNHTVLLFSGYQRVNFRTFLKAELTSTIIWAPLMLSLGYFFSYAALNVSKELSKFSLIVIGLIFGLFLFDKLLKIILELFENFEKNIDNGGK